VTRVSEHYQLGRDQPSLEFVDVEINGDTPVFIDPRTLRFIDSPWAESCVSLLQNFFDTVIAIIRSGKDSTARALLSTLGEPNETRLGLSLGRSRGRGMGKGLANAAWSSLSTSRAVSSGLLEDLEDTVLFVDGIGFDIVSDIATNIIRGPLTTFTQDACAYYDIPLKPGVVSGALWNPTTQLWYQTYEPLPVVNHRRLLLVPKAIVRRNQTFNPSEYYTHYILPQLQLDELRAGSSLVEVLRDGRRRVTKKSVKAKYGGGKKVNLDTTVNHPSLLDQYRSDKSVKHQPPNHLEVADMTDTPLPDWDALLSKLRAVHPGPEEASDYHRAVETLLTTLFYPALDMPRREFKIHNGRKRIDITYVNNATTGFFDWVNRVQQAPAPYVFVECKNYGTSLGNPEVDQLGGRFSPLRGRVGLLCHRGFGGKKKLVARCRDTALDGRGFIIVLDDQDIGELVESRKANPESVSFQLLQRRFEELI